jgi:iron complex transport system permease protein
MTFNAVDSRLLNAILLVALLLVLALVVNTGAVDIDLGKAIDDAWNQRASVESLIFFDIRLPRALLAALVGATLGLAGAALQGLLRNPLAEPGIIGVSNGAALGAVLVFYYGLAGYAWFVLPLAGLAGALLAVLCIFILVGQSRSIITLIVLAAGFGRQSQLQGSADRAAVHAAGLGHDALLRALPQRLDTG